MSPKLICIASIIVCLCIQSVLSISPSDKQIILNKHNEVRRRMPAVVMVDLVWDDNLQTVASNYAAECNFEHNMQRTEDYQAVGGSGYVGENIAGKGVADAGTGYPTSTEVVQLWINEEAHWTFPLTCSDPPCGHWTQMIWNETTRVGCEFTTDCTSIEHVTMPPSDYPYRISFLVCDYATGGNNGPRPFEPITVPSAPSATGPVAASTTIGGNALFMLMTLLLPIAAIISS